jgi:hypothetical protein
MNPHGRRRTIRSRYAPRGALVCSFVAAVCSAFVASPPSGAADSGSVTLSLTAAPLVRSITVGAVGGASYRGCFLNSASTGTTLRFPNGYCNTDAGQISVALGEIASVVDVQTTTLTATGGTPWSPCDCTPGLDQFRLNIMPYFGTMTPVSITSSPVCDYATFAQITGASSSGCVTIPANSIGSPNLRLTGPTSVSSNPTGSWSHTVTWRALPPLTNPAA